MGRWFIEQKIQMGNSYKKLCWSLLVIRKMHVKRTVTTTTHHVK